MLVQAEEWPPAQYKDRYQNNNRRGKYRGSQNYAPREDIICEFCYRSNHRVRDCRLKQEIEWRRQQSQGDAQLNVDGRTDH